MLAPIAPHLGEECWQLLGNEETLFGRPDWLEFDITSISMKTKLIVIQINGKVRAKLEIPYDSDELTIKKEVYNHEKVIPYLKDKAILKEIYVPNKIYNIVVK